MQIMPPEPKKPRHKRPDILSLLSGLALLAGIIEAVSFGHDSSWLFMVLVGIVVLCIFVIVVFDPLEKYDKTLDDLDHKKGNFPMPGILGMTGEPLSKSLREEDHDAAKRM